MSIITVGTVAGKLLYSCEPRVFVIERSRIVSMKTFLVDFYWQQTRNEILLRYEKATRTNILLLHCKPVEDDLLYSCETRVVVIERSRIVSMKTFLVDFYWQQTRNEILLRYEKATRTKILLLHCPSLRLAVARTERELKDSFQVVSRGKAVYNETPVECIPEEG
ncbi:hypothetical protein T12_16876 [Trichinella patagoniensis]|uniref:Uncharacterized protein n=1 Tax=Trichinella patagoniensis TaxID=990121 RepID=A0A0V0Z6E0_9BILA|nr:hypothetical protein T12_16876 [Trichinella patagoniensis]